MIEIKPIKNIGSIEIKTLRKLCSKSIAEIIKAARENQSIRTFHIFGQDWENQRQELVAVYNLYASEEGAPFVVVDTEENESEELSPQDLYRRLQFWRGIELETQMNSDLENGHIKNPGEFVAHDDDWV